MGIHHHGRPVWCLISGPPCGADAVGERFLDETLDLEVEREHEIPSRPALAHQVLVYDFVRRVDDHLFDPGPAAQEAVVHSLNPPLSHDVTRVVAWPGLLEVIELELIRADLPEIAEDLSRDVALRIDSHGHLVDPDPGEVLGVLLDDENVPRID